MKLWRKQAEKHNREETIRQLKNGTITEYQRIRHQGRRCKQQYLSGGKFGVSTLFQKMMSAVGINKMVEEHKVKMGVNPDKVTIL